MFYFYTNLYIMMLVVDIGNSNIVLTVFKGDEFTPVLRIKTLKEESFLFYEYEVRNYFLEQDINGKEIKKAVISSVVPELTQIFEDLTKNHLFINDPIIVSYKTTAGLKINLDDPKELGSDLIANAVRAFELFKEACIIVDFGTALTIMAVSYKGEILGGTIVPGLKTAVSALTSQTSQLPEVFLKLPSKVIGSNTTDAISSGLLNGYENLVNGLINQMENEMGMKTKRVLTGGLSMVIPNLRQTFDIIDSMHTIKGIKAIGDYYS